jgi:hypothetical protein
MAEEENGTGSRRLVISPHELAERLAAAGQPRAKLAIEAPDPVQAQLKIVIPPDVIKQYIFANQEMAESTVSHGKCVHELILDYKAGAEAAEKMVAAWREIDAITEKVEARLKAIAAIEAPAATAAVKRAASSKKK